MAEGKNILVVTYWKLDDALVQTYTLPYLRIIREVSAIPVHIHLVTLEDDPIGTRPLEEGITNVQLQYDPFSKKALLNWNKKVKALRNYCKEQRIDSVHAWCTPGGAIGYLVASKLKLPLILDSYEPHAESMVENGTWPKGGVAYRVLHLLEKKQSRYADIAIGLVPEMADYAASRYGVTFKEFYVKPACVDQAVYGSDDRDSTRSELGISEEKVCVYAGKFGGIYHREAVFDFFKACHDHWNGQFKALILTNEDEAELKIMTQQAGFPHEAMIHMFVPHAEVARYLSAADFAVNPVKSVPTKRYCTSIKDGEYWAAGLPVAITPKISSDSEIIANEKIGVVISSFDEADLKEAVSMLDAVMGESGIRERIKAVGAKNRSFDIARDIYRKIYS